MVDKELELKIKRVKECMQLWVKIHDMYKNAVNRDTISPEDEKTFLETKSIIARKYQALNDLLGTGSSHEDKTFDVVSQVLSLKGVSAISDLSLNKIENDWHNSYIQLNKVLGELEGRQDNLRQISRIGLLAGRLSQNPIANLALAIIIIIGIYFLVNQFHKASREKITGPGGFLTQKEEDVLRLTVLFDQRDEDAAEEVNLSGRGVSYIRFNALGKLLESYADVAEKYDKIPEIADCTNQQIGIIRRYLGFYGRHQTYDQIAAELNLKPHEVGLLHRKGILALVKHYFYIKGQIERI